MLLRVYVVLAITTYWRIWAHTISRAVALYLACMAVFLLHESRVAPASNISQNQLNLLDLCVHGHNGLGCSNQLSISRTNTNKLTSASVSFPPLSRTYPTRARSFSLLLAMSRRNSCSTRRAVGMGYWKASCHDLRLLGSGASGAMAKNGLLERRR